MGYSPIAMAKNAIGLSIAAEEYGSSFFSNSGTPSGVLEHPGVLKEPEKVRDAWNDAYGGSSTQGCSVGRRNEIQSDFDKSS